MNERTNERIAFVIFSSTSKTRTTHTQIKDCKNIVFKFSFFKVNSIPRTKISIETLWHGFTYTNNFEKSNACCDWLKAVTFLSVLTKQMFGLQRYLLQTIFQYSSKNMPCSLSKCVSKNEKNVLVTLNK